MHTHAQARAHMRTHAQI